MRTLVDTNVLVRHLTGEPSGHARRATAFLDREDALILTDLIVGELVFVLGSFYRRPKDEIAAAVRSLLALPSILTIDDVLVLRSLDLYEGGLDFADAYLAAAAERWGIGRIASFDRAFDKLPSVERIGP